MEILTQDDTALQRELHFNLLNCWLACPLFHLLVKSTNVLWRVPLHPPAIVEVFCIVVWFVPFSSACKNTKVSHDLLVSMFCGLSIAYCQLPLPIPPLSATGESSSSGGGESTESQGPPPAPDQQAESLKCDEYVQYCAGPREFGDSGFLSIAVESY